MPSPSTSNPPISEESIVIDHPSPSRPTTLLLRTHRPYIYNSWAFNNRLRLKNQKLTKRQKSSCQIAFYSLWMCLSASIMIIVIYRFTDECSLKTNTKEYFIQCSRHWLFLIAFSISLCACCGVIFGVCRYFRSQTLNFLYDDHCQRNLTRNNSLLPMAIPLNSCYCSSPTSINGVSIGSFRQAYHDKHEYTNPTVITSQTNLSGECRMPPFNYDELPSDSNSILISNSPQIINHSNNRNTFFSISTLSSPQNHPSSARTSTQTNRTFNSIQSKTSLLFEDPCWNTSVSYPIYINDDDDDVNIWQKRERSPTNY